MIKRYLPYLLLGNLFGYVLIKSEVSSWYRIQEMFHFESFHMFGIIISAILTAFIGVTLLKRFSHKTNMEGGNICIPQKKPGRTNYSLGGLIFGIGWGIIGLCPGPIFALIGTGSLAAVLVLIGSLLGTLLYGMSKNYLP